MNLYNTSIVGIEYTDANFEDRVSNIISLEYHENEFIAAAKIIKDFEESFPECEKHTLIVDQIIFDGTTVTEIQKIDSDMR